MNELGIVALSFTAAFLGVLSLAALAGWARHPIDERISRLHSRKQADAPQSLSRNEHETMLSNLGRKLAPSEEKQKDDAKRRLMYAGYYSDTAYFVYWGLRMATMLAMPLVVFIAFMLLKKPAGSAIIPMAFAGGVGMFLPDIFLVWRKWKRQEDIFCGLPDALDLLVVCIEAGLGLDASMKKISDEFHISYPVLSREFQMTCAAMRLGQEREAALRELGDRSGVIDLKSLTCVLIQADRYGSSLSHALRVHADDMRTRRRQRAEEMAAKTTVKLIFPLVLFIFPAIFVVLGGPAVIKILEHFMNK